MYETLNEELLEMYKMKRKNLEHQLWFMDKYMPYLCGHTEEDEEDERKDERED